ncbi:MAG: CpaD family pilus assembly protein [Sphingomonadales bacterium]|nr:CpaD family pilus assembly protein [Sphingomonadales bacterium]
MTPVAHPARRGARTGLKPVARIAIALGLATAVSGCGGMSTYRGYESVHQPVVERNQFTLDLATGNAGLARGESERLAGWFSALNLRYGDRIAVDDPLASPATRTAVEQAASRYGLLVGNDVPVTQGYVNAGTARVIVSRTSASVPHCPDWSSNSETNLLNATHSNYGCAVNGNLAAMVANPEDLLRGAHGGNQTTAPTGDKAVGVFQSQAPTGAQGLKTTSSKGN